MPVQPYLSIDPMLAMPGMREWIQGSGVPVIAVSPIVGGAAIKGPAAKIMRELSLPASALAVARHYRGLIEGLVIDEADACLASAIADEGIACNWRRIAWRSRRSLRGKIERCGA